VLFNLDFKCLCLVKIYVMTDVQKIVEKINSFTMVDESVNHKIQKINISKDPSKSENALSFSVRTEQSLVDILIGLDLDKEDIEKLKLKFNSLRTRFDFKSLERFIVVGNNSYSV